MTQLLGKRRGEQENREENRRWLEKGKGENVSEEQGKGQKEERRKGK